MLRLAKEFRGSTDAELRALVPYFDEVAVPAGTRLAQEGRLSRQYFIVTEGKLETCRQGMQGKLEPGGSFGFKTMYDHGWDDATVTAASGARLLVMGHAQFRAVKAAVSEPSEFSEPALSRSLAS
jgi:CRP-like cAMP-binding protein